MFLKSGYGPRVSIKWGGTVYASSVWSYGVVIEPWDHPYLTIGEGKRIEEVRTLQSLLPTERVDYLSCESKFGSSQRVDVSPLSLRSTRIDNVSKSLLRSPSSSTRFRRV